MRKRQDKRSASILTLLILGVITLTFQFGAAGAFAQDADNDGFIDSIETSGIQLPGGMALATGETSLPACGGSTPRDKCVNAAAKDLFVIIKRAAGCPALNTCGAACSPSYGGSDIPMPSAYAATFDPLALVHSGLPVTTHEIIQTSGTSQQIGGAVTDGGWYAVKVIENLDPCSSYMGLATFGAPYSGSVATIYPEKIKNWIATACSAVCFTNKSGAKTCFNPGNSPSFICKNGVSATSVDMKAPNSSLAKLNGEFIQNIINHEVSHMINLASGSGTSADHHYPIAQGIIMEQFINSKATKDSKGNIVVTLYISTGYSNQDQTQYKLK